MNRDVFFNALSHAERDRIDAVDELRRMQRSIEMKEAELLSLIGKHPVLYLATVGRLDNQIAAYESRLLREGHRTDATDLKAMHLALAQLRGARESIQIPRPQAPAMPSPTAKEESQ